MTRRLRTDRMRERAAMIRATHLLRESADEVRAAYERGEISRNGARAAFGFRPVRGRIGKERVHARAGTGWLPPAFAEAVPDAYTAEQIAEWQRAWDETLGNDPQPQRLVWLPSRTVVRSERPRKSTPRGWGRMRQHTRNLLIDAMRPDPGDYGSLIRVQILKAYRFLPHELGLPALTAPANADTARADEAAQLDADLGLVAADISFSLRDLLPEGLEFHFERPEREPFPRRVAIPGPIGDDPVFIETFADPDLIEPAAKGALPPRFRRPSRRALVQFAVFAALGLIPLLAALLAH